MSGLNRTPTTSDVATAATPATSPSESLTDEKIVVLDFGSQYAQLIARRVREQNVYCQILRHDLSADRIAELNPKGIVLSGGPSSVYEPGAPRCDPKLFELGVPVLGICYGMQLACEALGGRVDHTPSREYGPAKCKLAQGNSLFEGLPQNIDVWMSHGDQVSAITEQFNPWRARRRVPTQRFVTARCRCLGCNSTPKSRTLRWAAKCCTIL